VRPTRWILPCLDSLCSVLLDPCQLTLNYFCKPLESSSVAPVNFGWTCIALSEKAYLHELPEKTTAFCRGLFTWFAKRPCKAPAILCQWYYKQFYYSYKMALTSSVQQTHNNCFRQSYDFLVMLHFLPLWKRFDTLYKVLSVGHSLDINISCNPLKLALPVTGYCAILSPQDRNPDTFHCAFLQTYNIIWPNLKRTARGTRSRRRKSRLWTNDLIRRKCRVAEKNGNSRWRKAPHP